MKNILLTALVALPFAAFAQQKPPVAQYWMSVETASGMSMPGMGATGGMAGMIGGMMGGGQQQSGRKISLHLGSQRPADAPNAAHDIPAGMNMGSSLPLLTPRGTSERQPTERERYESAERPKGRMLIYWGCGEATRAGQPVVIDFARGGQMPNMVGRNVASGGPVSNRTNGLWPNQQDSKAVPDSASLIGEHKIRGNYTPDIPFALGAGHDFMERVELATSARGAGATSVRWNAPSAATGYFATAMGGDGNDVVMWSSSEVQEMGGSLMDYIPPAEVARLIREKVVMPPQTTECTVPAAVVKQAQMFSFIAYGPEANFGFPPRPQDPQWYAKVRFKSTASTFLGDTGGSGRAQRAPAGAPSGDQSAQPSAPAAPDPVKDGINILRGIFGR
jgi:hypothetical protein